MALAWSAVPNWAGCCANAADESVRTAADAAAIMNVRIMDFLPVKTARAGRMRRYVLMTSAKQMPVDLQNTRPPTAATLSLKTGLRHILPFQVARRERRAVRATRLTRSRHHI